MLVFAPSASAWHKDTHIKIADEIYKTLDPDVQAKLNLKKMEEGSFAPDKNKKPFKDDRKYEGHRYKKSYNKAKTWLGRGRKAYNNHNYTYASYCFGVASHYITDTYAAPHCINKKKKKEKKTHKKNHKKYEKQGRKMAPTSLKYTDKSLISQLPNALKKGKKIWKKWKNAKKKSTQKKLIQGNLNDAASAAYSAIKNHI